MARDSKRGFGSRHGDPYAETPTDGAPVDIAAVRRDDELIDAIASDGPVATDSTDEYQMASLLANWRAELTGPPLPMAPNIDEVVAAVNQEIGARQARVAAGGRLRLLRPIAGAAAAVALVVGGMTAFSYNAEPGDPLWKVKQVVFSDQADSTVANMDTTSDLQEAERLIADGNPEEAKIHLDRASTRASDVNDAAKRDDLLAWFDRLKDEVQKQLPTTGTPDTTKASETSPSPGTTSVSGSDPSTRPDTTLSGTPVDPRSAQVPGTDPGTPPTSSSADTSILIAPTQPPTSTVDTPTTVEPPVTTVEAPVTTNPPEPTQGTEVSPPATRTSG